MSLLSEIPRFSKEYIADYLDLFGKVIEDDGRLICTKRCIGQFVRKHAMLVELVTGIRMLIDWNIGDEDKDETITDRDRMEEFKAVFSAAMVCYERITQTAVRNNLRS